MADLLETLMILCFGISWPLSIRKSLVSRTSKGKSVTFEFFIWVGYIFGIIRKILLWSAAAKTGASLEFLFYLGWIFYVLNFIEISIDIALYYRNLRYDREAEAKQ